MKHIVFLLEESSAKEFLKGIYSRIVPETLYSQIYFTYITFEGKQDLEKNIVRKLRKYRVPDAHFIILRDQDASDCRILKDSLLGLCKKSGRSNFKVRIACREIESWYIADLKAVENGLNISGLNQQQNIEKFRNPDHLSTPSRELRNLTKNAYQKISGSRVISQYIDLNNNRSNSFKVFIQSIRDIIGE